MQRIQENQQLNKSEKIEGLLPSGYAGVLIGQNERVEELNRRVIDRISTDGILQPNFDPRPVSTKYSLFPIIDRRATPKEAIFPTPQYEPNNKFYSNLEKGPVDGFLSNVNLESSLRNQYHALQRGGAPQSTYIPSSDSDLYRVEVVSRPSQQPFPDLFKREDFYQSRGMDNLNSHIGNDTFFNHTRTQLRTGAQR
tara:strand:+ start:703 stop:1290 length:588 start_codon:yes stop_codon:yes gene_type:complete